MDLESPPPQSLPRVVENLRGPNKVREERVFKLVDQGIALAGKREWERWNPRADRLSRHQGMLVLQCQEFDRLELDRNGAKKN